MGTNYYLVFDVCEHCGRGEERLHIGKSSFGWCFSLHVEPDSDAPRRIRSLDDWRALWLRPDTRIENECHEAITPREMDDIILNRHGKNREATPFGYDSWDEFHRRNNSLLDEKAGLLRHRIDGRCIGRGDGTCDLITGWFR